MLLLCCSQFVSSLFDQHPDSASQLSGATVRSAATSAEATAAAALDALLDCKAEKGLSAEEQPADAAEQPADAAKTQPTTKTRKAQSAQGGPPEKEAPAAEQRAARTCKAKAKARKGQHAQGKAAEESAQAADLPATTAKAPPKKMQRARVQKRPHRMQQTNLRQQHRHRQRK